MRSFTLVEMLISLAIFILLAGLIIANPIGTTQKRELLNAAEREQTELRRTQGFGVATQNFNGTPPAGGWGIHFEPAQPCYIIFADTNGNGLYNPSGIEVGDICNAAKNDSLSERFERVFIPSSVSVLSVSPSLGGALDIVYRPPLLEVRFNNVLAATFVPPVATVVLKSKNGATKTVSANSVGNVEIGP